MPPTPGGVAGKGSRKFGNYRRPHLSSSGEQRRGEGRLSWKRCLVTHYHGTISFFLCLFVLCQSCVTDWLVLVLTVTAYKTHGGQDDKAHRQEPCRLVHTHTHTHKTLSSELARTQSLEDRSCLCGSDRNGESLGISTMSQQTGSSQRSSVRRKRSRVGVGATV